MALDRPRRDPSVVGLPATEIRDRLARGVVRAVDVAEAHLEHIAGSEAEVRAWAWQDPDFVRTQAKALDAHRESGRPVGALHGVPVGIKDIVDTVRIPTENGTVLDAGRTPVADAFVVQRLKAAGALIAGKTRTTELAYLHPTETRNPAAPGRTPGGSSSGSAAAVAAAHVPLAIGTQTGGSIIRPAAYCGIVGYKPTFGAIPRSGVLTQSPSLDTVGVLARTVADAAMLAEVLFGHDPQDRATAPSPHPRLLATATSTPPVSPTLAFVRPPGWDTASADTHEAFAELVAFLGDSCFEVELPSVFDRAAAIREQINFAEMAKFYYGYERRGWDRLSAETREAMERGKALAARDYIAALDWPTMLYAGLDEIFARCDAILTPATPGPAPAGLASTGSAIFNGLWTLCGTPAVTVPLLESREGLPLGVQLVGPRHGDGRLLRTAQWLMERIQGSAQKRESHT
jgi:Asp-tRNA(Asn)/Glu-tRNA(Gln) amidotransferase A subunit family amidase